MTSEARGSLLYAYRPIPANPMTVAVLLIGLVVTFVIGPVAAGPEGLWPLGGLCFVPLALVLGAMAVFKPSPTFVFESGIEISLPLWRRILGQRRYYPWSEIRDVYPRSYEVAGSFLSPFIVAAILIALSVARLELSALILVVALALATLPPAASMVRTLRQSDRRNEILSELAKYQEHLRERAEAIRPPSETAGVDLKQG